MTPELSADKLRELLHYDPGSGLFTRRVKTSSNHAVGDVAGATGAKGYVQIGVGGGTHYAHRLAWLYMTGSWPTALVDHKNRCKADNRWTNLREAGRQENARNAGVRSDSLTRVRGVTWERSRKRWRSHIKIGGREIFLGRFATLEEAAAARAAAEQKHFAEFGADPITRGIPFFAIPAQYAPNVSNNN